MKNILLIIGVNICFALCSNGEDIMKQQFEDYAVKNKDYILSLENKYGAIDIPLEEARIFFSRLEKKEKLTEQEELQFLFCLLEFGKYAKNNSCNGGKSYKTFKIMEPVIAELLILAMEDANKELSTCAIQEGITLRHRDIDKYIDRIVASAIKMPDATWSWYYFPESSWIKYAELKDMMRKKLSGNDVEDIRRLGRLAGLGDITARQKLLNVMKNVNLEFYPRRVTIELLAALGRQEDIIALLEEMNDNTIADGETLRYFILEEISKNYPEDSLFVNYTNHASEYNTGNNQYREKIKKLYTDICAWAKKELGYDLKLDKASLEIYDPSKSVQKYPMKEEPSE